MKNPVLKNPGFSCIMGIRFRARLNPPPAVPENFGLPGKGAGAHRRKRENDNRERK